MNISEKAAHLKGLMEGMEYDKTTKEGKLFTAIADLLEDLSLSVQDLEDEAAVLGDYIDELDEDLGEVERLVYDIDEDFDDEDEDFDDEDECECDCCCDEDCLELTCPACGQTIFLDWDDIEDAETVECPSCSKVLTVSRDEDDQTEEEKD